MRIELTYKEIAEYVLAKYNLRVNLSRVDDQTVAITIRIAIFPTTLTLKIENVWDDSNIALTYKSGFGIDSLISKGLSFLASAKPEYSRCVETKDGNAIWIHLAEIDELKSLFAHVGISSISFTDDDIVIDTEFKLESPSE
jgi:hypothetical protein